MKFSRLLTAALAAAATSYGCDTAADHFAQDSNESSAPAHVAAAGEATDAPQTPAPAPVAQTPQKKAASTPVADQAKAIGVNPDAAVLQDFTRRVEAYLKLRKDAVKGTPALKETSDAGKIKAAQDGLSMQIRAARAGAKHGDIFTPEITTKFRRLLNPELKGDDGRDAKAIIKDDAPTNVPFKVNAKYPDGAPLPTVPANLLLNLPTVPEPLQYRIIDKHLILLDEDADVILDYALNVIS
jgi:hypothetical protein